MDILGYKIWKKSRSGRRIEKLIEEYERNSLNGFRESEDGQRILKLKNNPLNTPANKVITKMQREQPALYDALTMWFDPKMEGITQADIANWFDYPEWYGVKDQWNALSYKKALTNLSGKPGDMWMQSLDPNLPTPIIMEDGRLKMNDAKCTLILDRLTTNQEMDTIFWYMDYEVPEGFMTNPNRTTMTFYPWVLGNYLYLVYNNGSTGITGISKGLGVTYGSTNNTREDGLYQLPTSYGFYMSATPNTITISSATGDNLKYTKSVIPNHPCYTTRRKNSSTSTYFDRRRTCCYYKADEIQIFDRSIGANTSRNANTLGNLPAHFGICDRRSDYQVNPETASYRPAGDCILGWFIAFNRPLTDEEIAWVEDNMYSTKLKDIPYRPFAI